MLEYETQVRQSGLRFIFGVDEAGRGPLAGPVVAAAVCLREHDFKTLINDSKKMTARNREAAFHEIFNKAYVGIGMMSEGVIDTINILNATFKAMDAAIENLVRQIPTTEISQEHLKAQVMIFVDGNQFRTSLPFRYKTIIGGDGLSLSIACASIVAKVYRDRLMDGYDQVFPQYGFNRHKGYPTVQHRQAISQHGLSVIHRKSFA